MILQRGEGSAHVGRRAEDAREGPLDGDRAGLDEEGLGDRSDPRGEGGGAVGIALGPTDSEEVGELLGEDVGGDADRAARAEGDVVREERVLTTEEVEGAEREVASRSLEVWCGLLDGDDRLVGLGEFEGEVGVEVTAGARWVVVQEDRQRRLLAKGNRSGHH